MVYDKQILDVQKPLLEVFRGRLKNPENASRLTALLVVLTYQFGEGDAYAGMILRNYLVQAGSKNINLPLALWRRLSCTNEQPAYRFRNDQAEMLEVCMMKYPLESINKILDSVFGRARHFVAPKTPKRKGNATEVGKRRTH